MQYFVFIQEQWLLVATLAVLIYLYTLREKQKSGKGLSVHGVTQLLNRGAVLLDIREPAEFKAGHIVDAINVPHNKLADSLKELEKHKAKTIILADKYGQHAGHAGRTLAAAGFDVCRLEGGMAEWSNQNLPLVK